VRPDRVYLQRLRIACLIGRVKLKPYVVFAMFGETLLQSELSDFVDNFNFDESFMKWPF